MLKLLAVAVASVALTSPAMADVLSMPDNETAPAEAPVNVPTRGASMENVRTTFGEPLSKVGPVGQPPITRWNYGSFVVVFEHNLVLNTVIPAKPPTIYHQDELTAVE